MTEKIKILAVDDNDSVLSFIKEVLELEGYEVLTALNGTAALQTFAESQPALVLLDIRLPDIDGYTICKRIRKSSRVPIIMVTGKDLDEEEIIGLEVGADDYIKKPFSTLVLLSRVKAALRRLSFPENHSPELSFDCQDLRIDYIRQIVTLGQEKLDLTATEYKILVSLAVQSGRIVSSEELAREIWGEETNQVINALRVNINRLRGKMKDNTGQSRYIETIPGQGYFLKSPISGPSSASPQLLN